MADYEKIAGEVKARGSAALAVEAAKQEQSQALALFFKRIEFSLGEEINEANPALFEQGLLIGDKVGGITKAQNVFETQIVLAYGKAARCEVNLDSDQSVVQVEMLGEANERGIVVPQKLAFQLYNGVSGVYGIKPCKNSGEFGAKRIAEIIVEGMIRGYF